MYLSKISLQPSAQAAAELAKLTANGAYTAHQLLWQLFTEETQRNFLFREEMTMSGRPEFYLLSETKPKALESIFLVQTKEFMPVLQEGQRLAYKLRVNPTVCVTDENGKSKRHDVLMHAKKHYKDDIKTSTELSFIMHQAAHEWLANDKRLAKWGIQLDSLPEVQRYSQHKSKKKSGHEIQFSSVDFEGVLTIKNPNEFLEQYRQGFGRAKALGCGLMLIRPI